MIRPLSANRNICSGDRGSPTYACKEAFGLLKKKKKRRGKRSAVKPWKYTRAGKLDSARDEKRRLKKLKKRLRKEYIARLGNIPRPESQNHFRNT